MSGRFVIAGLGSVGAGGAEPQTLGEFVYDAGKDEKHDHIVFEMSNLAIVRYNDARRFGYMTLIEPGGLATHPLFQGLGIEPLGAALTPAYLAERGKGRKQPLKSFLLDQRILAGIGNIYACEALWRAKLLPDRPASVLALNSGAPSEAAKKLAPAIREVLEDAIEAGGSSLRDYRRADGSLGYFQHRFAVYGREGQPCQRRGCRGTIARLVQNGRSTFYCPVCQK
jgi:formamidopyrimidine-DNA glycosylase